MFLFIWRVFDFLNIRNTGLQFSGLFGCLHLQRTNRKIKFYDDEVSPPFAALHHRFVPYSVESLALFRIRFDIALAVQTLCRLTSIFCVGSRHTLFSRTPATTCTSYLSCAVVFFWWFLVGCSKDLAD